MSTLVVPVTSRDHARGPGDAGLTLVEYGDLECPHCALVHPFIAEIAGELRDSLQVVFRHFPLSTVHPHAQRAAEALEAAASQGKFWQMIDLLYADNTQLDDEALARHARKLRLDLKRFQKELASGVHRDRVRADFLGGVRSGVAGTPTFFINGVKYGGTFEFEAIVGALLTASRKG